eukprot:s39_g21.t1
MTDFETGQDSFESPNVLGTSHCIQGGPLLSTWECSCVEADKVEVHEFVSEVSHNVPVGHLLGMRSCFMTEECKGEEIGTEDGMSVPYGPHDSKLLAIIDTACTKTVAGYAWFEQYVQVADHFGFPVQTIDESDHFKFGASKVFRSMFSVKACFAIHGKPFGVRVSIVPCNVPLLFSRPVLGSLGMCYDVAKQQVGLTLLNLSELPLLTSPTGHPALLVSDFGERPMLADMPDFSPEDIYMPAALECRGVPIHPKWTVPELRSILIEQLETDKPAKGENPLKGLTKLSLDELVAEAEKLKITMPAKPTRGLLMRLIRDSKSTPGQTIVSFGKFRGWMYQEVPVGYLQWNVQEVQANQNCHPDLARLATWAQGEMERREKAASSGVNVLKDPEANAVVPPPRLKSMSRPGDSSDASWSRVGSSSQKSSAHAVGPEVISDSDIDNEEEDPNLTIKKLEDRIAALKKRGPN